MASAQVLPSSARIFLHNRPTIFHISCCFLFLFFFFTTYFGSIEGWLILAAKHRYNNKTKAVNFFLNPVTHARVMIPSQSTITRRPPYSSCTLSSFKKVVASSPPTRPMKQECIVAGLSYGGLLAFCRPTDSSWTFIETKDLLKFKDIEIIDGKLYAVTTVEQASAFLMVYDILPANANGYRLHSKDSFRCDCRCGGPFLVKDSAANQLFMILQKNSFRHQSKNEKLFHVFKLDYCKTNGGPPWEEVVDLGDRINVVSERRN